MRKWFFIPLTLVLTSHLWDTFAAR